MDDRRILIADSAIEVIAVNGIRALTHRAVDAQAELASGSTSYYCRTKAQLLDLTVERLVSTFVGFGEQHDLESNYPKAAHNVASVLAAMVDDLLINYRSALIARQALILELSRHQDTTNLVESIFNSGELTMLLERLSVQNTRNATLSLLAMLEGLLWEHTVGRMSRMSPDEVGILNNTTHIDAALGSYIKGPERKVGLFGLIR